MYVPASFRESDQNKLVQVIQRYPFATLITPDGDDLAVSHVPLVVRWRDDRLVLAGHVARANEHWRVLSAGKTSTAIFHGPHAYISPTWYATSPAVPTWNYAVVHAIGSVEVLDGEGPATEIVRELTEIFEDPGESRWRPDTLEPDFHRRLIGAIVTFEMRVDRLEGKFKLSQNRSDEDRRGAIANLKASAAQIAQELAAMMEGESR